MRTPTKKRPPMEMEPGEGKAHEMKETPEEEIREGSEAEEGEDYEKKSRKRSAKGAKNTKAPMDCEGCAGKKTGKCKKCMAKPMADGSCGGPMKKRSDALTAPEYLAACELGIQDRSRTYIRARLDTSERLDLKCGKGAISQGEKCSKGTAQRVNPNVVAAKQIAARTNKSGNLVEFSQFNKSTGNLQKAKSQKKSGSGPSVAVQVGQTAKGVGLGALEAVKWGSGYNIGKAVATGLTKGKNERAGVAEKAGSIAASTLLFGGAAGLGAARRVGVFGSTDLQEHAKNQKKEKKWRRSVGYKDSVYAPGFTVDYVQLGV